MNPRRGAVVLSTFLLLGGLLVLMLHAPSARAAARFTYELCDPAFPGGGEPRLTFGPDAAGSVGAFDTCAQPDGSTYLYQLAHSAAASDVLDVTVPPTPGGWVETETLSAGSYRLGPGNERSYVRDEGWPAIDAGEQTRTFFVHDGTGGGTTDGDFPVVLTCSAFYAPGCGPAGGIYVRYITALEVDPDPPTIAPPTGPLLATGVVRGHQELGASATDIGGGLQNLEVLVNGVSAATPEAGACEIARVANSSYDGLAAPTPTPCPSHLSASWSLDTSRPPFREGSNAVEVCAEDLATQGEPNRTCSPQAAVMVDDSCTESPAAGGQVLSAGFAGSGTITVGFGGKAEVSGTLTDGAGDPVAGATICVRSRTLGREAPARPAGTAQTDAEGHFVYEVPAGPDRELLVGYRHDSFQIAHPLRYYANASPTLRANPQRLENGDRVRLRGTLPGPGASGRVVILQASVVGSRRWITFRRATTDADGNFAGGYRFHSTTRRTGYRFRAVVPRQNHYPYVEGHSRAVRVVVAPAPRAPRRER